MSKGRNIDQFAESHDRTVIIPKKIKSGLSALGDSWEYESEFIKRCKLSNKDISDYREQFKEHVVDLTADRRRAWAGTKRFADKMRERVQ